MDWTPYMMRLQDKNPDYVFGVIHQVLTAHADTGMPRLAEATYCYQYGETNVLAADFGEQSIGCLATQTWANPTDTDIPGVVLMNQLHSQNSRDTDHGYHSMYRWGFVLGVAACEVIEIAVRNDGYPVTTDAIVRALDVFDSDIMGMSARTVFPAGSRQGNTKMRLTIVDENVNSVPYTDWMSTIPLDETLEALGLLE
jgi:hypothetical protein